MKKLFMFSIIFLLLTVAHAQLYADIEFEVRDDGRVQITGDSNYDGFEGITSKYTSKKGEFWLLNISTPVIEEYIYEIKLPENTVINFIRANAPARIEEQSGSIVVTATGSSKPIDVVIQYSIGSGEAKVLVPVLIVVLIILAFVVMWQKKRKPVTYHEEKPKKKLDRSRFTDRQLDILDYLEKHGTVTQAKLEKDLTLPKSSLSRNLHTLEQKKVIFLETRGMSNVVGLHNE